MLFAHRKPATTAGYVQILPEAERSTVLTIGSRQRKGRERMSSDIAERAGRVAGTIGVFKWILIGIILLSAGLYAQDRIFLSGADNAPTTGVVVAAGAVVIAVMIWVLFWGFEHTLRALAEITANTRGLRSQSFPPQAEQLQPPPALPGTR